MCRPQRISRGRSSRSWTQRVSAGDPQSRRSRAPVSRSSTACCSVVASSTGPWASSPMWQWASTSPGTIHPSTAVSAPATGSSVTDPSTTYRSRASPSGRTGPRNRRDAMPRTLPAACRDTSAVVFRRCGGAPGHGLARVLGCEHEPGRHDAEASSQRAAVRAVLARGRHRRGGEPGRARPRQAARPAPRARDVRAGPDGLPRPLVPRLLDHRVPRRQPLELPAQPARTPSAVRSTRSGGRSTGRSSRSACSARPSGWCC